MSRPRKLLCVAMQSETYEKSKGAFNSNWKSLICANDLMQQNKGLIARIRAGNQAFSLLLFIADTHISSRF